MVSRGYLGLYYCIHLKFEGHITPFGPQIVVVQEPSHSSIANLLVNESGGGTTSTYTRHRASPCNPSYNQKNKMRMET
jgi:hypothetical protein